MSTSPAQAIRDAAARLQVAGCASPVADARILLAHAAQASPTQLLTIRELDADVLAHFQALIDRRVTRVPVQHLTGTAWFRGVQLQVGPGVFIPRPETEVVAQAVIDEARHHSRPLVVELCAGSGAISAATLDEVPNADVVAIENQPEALTWLRRNLTGPRATIVAADIARPRPELAGRVQVVVANPPYVGLDEAADLPIEVSRFDPPTALFAGPDGLALMPTLIQAARSMLMPRGLVVIEHGDEQAAAMTAMLTDAGFDDVVSHRDLAGRARFVTGRLVGRWSGE